MGDQEAAVVFPVVQGAKPYFDIVLWSGEFPPTSPSFGINARYWILRTPSIEGMYVMVSVFLHRGRQYFMIRSFQQETGSEITVPPLNLRLKCISIPSPLLLVT